MLRGVGFQRFKICGYLGVAGLGCKVLGQLRRVTGSGVDVLGC